MPMSLHIQPDKRATFGPRYVDLLDDMHLPTQSLCVNKSSTVCAPTLGTNINSVAAPALLPIGWPVRCHLPRHPPAAQSRLAPATASFGPCWSMEPWRREEGSERRRGIKEHGRMKAHVATLFLDVAEM